MKIFRIFASTYFFFYGMVYLFSGGIFLQISRIPLNSDVLKNLGFEYDGNIWVHSQEQSFAIKLKATCFYISIHGNLAKHPYNLTVGELEEQFYKRTGKLLY